MVGFQAPLYSRDDLGSVVIELFVHSNNYVIFPFLIEWS